MSNIFAISDYFTEIEQVRIGLKEKPILDLIQILDCCREQNRKIFIFGNGGSAATASHFCEDLGKGTLDNPYSKKRMKVISLVENVPYLTAWANDEKYCQIFLQQLINLGESKDIAIGISVSGNSKNVLEAINYANLSGMTTVGFTGFEGGILGKMVQNHINVPSSDFGIVESIHLFLMHYIIKVLKKC